MSFAPSLGVLTAAKAHRQLVELWGDPDELARSALMTVRSAGATHLLFPFDLVLLAEACGCVISWTEDEPRIERRLAFSPGELEPEDVIQSARVPAAVSVVRSVMTTTPIAARVPSGQTLLGQLGGDPKDEDQSAVADDVVAAFTRVLLESGSSELVVEEVSSDVDVAPSLDRLASHFGVPVRMVGSGRSASLLPVSTLRGDVDGTIDASGFCGDQLVLTDGAVPADVDLGRLARLSAAIRAIEVEPC